jgi:hypothetical protein
MDKTNSPFLPLFNKKSVVLCNYSNLRTLVSIVATPTMVTVVKQWS